MSEKNIFQRINAIMQKVKYVKKDTQVSGGGPAYTAVTHDQVASVCRQALVDEGVVVVPSITDHRMLIQRDLKNDVKMHLYEADFKIAFVNMDKPDDRLEVDISSQAADNGDKAPGKAMSYAVKYALLKVLCLESGDDEESRVAGLDTITPVQVKAINSMLEGTGDLKTRMLGYCDVEEVSQITKGSYDELVRMIKRAKKNNENN